MKYLLITILCLIIMVVPYVIAINKKEKSRFIIMCIHTLDVIIANILNFTTLKKLLNHCNGCAVLGVKIKGIDFSRAENMLGINIIDANEVKILFVIILSIVTIALLRMRNTENKEKSRIAGCIVLIVIEMLMSLVLVNG